jgi:membrane protein
MAATSEETTPRTLKGKGLLAFNKFNNDWTMNLAGMVSYGVLTSFLPLLLAVFTLLALLPATFGNPQDLANQIDVILPANVRAEVNVSALLHAVSANAGILWLISIAGLLWGGSNLFGSIESAFAIIFRVKTRDFLPQKIMALGMIVLLVLLLPLSFASSFVVSAASTRLSHILPASMTGLLAQIIAGITSVTALFNLFLAIYTVVPNIPVRWRYAWRGAVVATIAMYVVNTLFPFYTAHFVNTKQYGVAALAGSVILVIWFWFFSVILLVGAQVNALVMGIGAWRFDLSRTLMEYKIPTVGGAPTAVEALRRKDDPEVLDSPLGLARDSHDATPVAQDRQPSASEQLRARLRNGYNGNDPPPSA